LAKRNGRKASWPTTGKTKRIGKGSTSSYTTKGLRRWYLRHSLPVCVRSGGKSLIIMVQGLAGRYFLWSSSFTPSNPKLTLPPLPLPSLLHWSILPLLLSTQTGGRVGRLVQHPTSTLAIFNQVVIDGID